jgi:hypothetical protein
MPLTTTFREFVDMLEAITVTGVLRHFTRGPPESLATAKLPAKWVMNLQDTEGAIVFGEQGGGQSSISADVYIAVGPTVQNTQGANFDNAVDLMDAYKTAIRAAGLCAAKSKLTFNTRLTVVAVAGIDYWMIISTVSA